MKKLLFIILIGLLFLLACIKEDPKLAATNELAYTTYSENFVCQPVAINNGLVSVMNRNNSTFLCSYNIDGDKNWQQNIDQYVLNGFTYQTINKLRLKKDQQNNLFLLMNSVAPIATTTASKQIFKVVKFDQDGQYLSQLTDNIRYYDTVIINKDTISFVGNYNFKIASIVNFSNGNIGVISSQISSKKDTTFLQMSFYNSNLQFIATRFSILPGKLNLIDVYSTSDDRLLFHVNVQNGSPRLFMVDLQGNTIFNNPYPGLLHTIFVSENSDGNYIISTAFVDNTIVLKGVIICISKTGQTLWAKEFTASPSWVMLSFKEVSDGYLFSGLTSGTLLEPDFDWRTTFSKDEHHAVLLKTDFDVNEIWKQITPGDFYSGGAAVIGDYPFSFFGGKYENNIQNTFLIKLNSEGIIPN